MKTKSLALAGLLTAALLAPVQTPPAAAAEPSPTRELPAVDDCVPGGRMGDQSGDGKADVLAIQAGTGDLYYYRSTGGRLSPGVKTGHGWGRMVAIHQSASACLGPDKGRVHSLIALRSDGAIFNYPRIGPGRYGTPTRIATAPAGTRSFAVLEGEWMDGFTRPPTLLALAGTSVFRLHDQGGDDRSWSEEIAWMGETARLASIDGLNFVADFQPYTLTSASLLTVERNGDLWQRVYDAEWGSYAGHKLGHGWSKMQTITSPGSLDGDSIGDLVARRVDGNLYSYRGRKDGRLGSAVLIGTGWHKMRLLG